MSEFILDEVKLDSSGNKVLYFYRMTDDIKKYFKEDFFSEYDIHLNGVPDSILAIPLLANILPISWLVGFDVIVNSVDKQFYDAILKIKDVFEKEFSLMSSRSSKFIFNNLEENFIETKTDAMLFSGGVDAYATYFNHYQDSLDLILIQGADIPLEDHNQWELAKKHIINENILNNNNKHYIKMNCRDFYSYHVNELLPGGGWWGKVQHGLSLICAVAPLAYKNGYKNLYIAATHTPNFKIFWGSMPEIDNNIKWSNTKVIHDGYNMLRIEKVESIVHHAKLLNSSLNLRVCYSELNNGLNCNKCEKCYRTMLGLLIFQANPNEFGFNVNHNIYIDIGNKIQKGFSTKGVRRDWEAMLKPLSENNIYQFSEHEYEKKQLIEKVKFALSLEIVEKLTYLDQAKRKLIAKFPRLFKKYLILRGRLK